MVSDLSLSLSVSLCVFLLLKSVDFPTLARPTIAIGIGVRPLADMRQVHTPPSMNRLSKAIFNSKKYSFSSFCVYSLNSLPLEILTKHLPNDPQIVSHTPKMTPENAWKNSPNRLFIE